MDRTSKIYVAGHTGLVGSALVRKLTTQGFTHIITQTRAQLDLRDARAVDRFFNQEKPDYVFLAAAKVGGIMANQTKRTEFLLENLKIQNNVISSAFKNRVVKLLFFGSSCIYPKNCGQPIKESYLLGGPLEYTNEPYAVAKIAGLKLCENLNLQYGTNFIAVMPTNLYGPGDNYDLNTSHVLPAILKKCIIGKLLVENNIEQAIKVSGVSTHSLFDQFTIDHQISKDKIVLWGSGKPKREFLHSEDLAEACLMIMNHLEFKQIKAVSDQGSYHLNIGYGEDISIKDLAFMIRELVGYEGSFEFDISKPDGVYQKLLDSSKVNQLGWRPKISLATGIKQLIDQILLAGYA